VTKSTGGGSIAKLQYISSIAATWRRHSQTKRLRQAGQSILIVDKNLHELADTADRIYVMQNGHVVWSGDGKSFEKDPGAQVYLGVPD
jgi:ABC-type branched-subunit amino acid transport system ATPase component